MRYKAGDIVTVRSWQSMADEYGFVDRDENEIPIPGVFIDKMRHLCGNTYTISEILISGKGYRFVDDDEAWLFSDEMLEDSIIKNIFTLGVHHET